MDDIKTSFVFVGVDSEDVLEDRIEIEEKPVFITQDPPAQCDPSPAETQTKKERRSKKLKFTHRKLRSSARLANKNQQSDNNKNNDSENGADPFGNKQVEACETSPINLSDRSDFQISDVVVKAVSCFDFENNNDSDSKTNSAGVEECEDPLQSCSDSETTKNVAEELICDIHLTPAPAAPKDPNVVAIDKNATVRVNITSLVPNIKKLCANCETVAELIQNDINAAANKVCNKCFKPVAYCCKLCLEISTLNDMLIHVFKDHFNKAVFSVANPTDEFICASSLYVDSAKLKLHEMVCDDLPNLFCQFCEEKTKSKGEMRKHYLLTHQDKFEMDELEEMLNEVVEEGDTVMSLLTRQYGYCNICNKHVSLRFRPIHCLTCQTRLIYHCKDSACSSLVYTRLSSLQSHLRHHVNTGWSTDPPKMTQKTKRKMCHVCNNFVNNRRKHIATKHPDILLCKCELCGKELRNVGVWKKHRKKYCPVAFRKLQCGHCWFRSFDKSRLRRHLRSVHTHLYTGKRPKCDKCGITWAGLYRLRWHLSRCSGDLKAERAKQREVWARRGVVTLS